MATWQERYGSWALVTGASSGIGAALAEELARAGINLITVARTAENLETRAASLRKAYGVTVQIVPADLSTEEGMRRVIEAAGDREIGILVPCAAVESHGYFVEESLERHRALAYLDVVGPMELVHYFGGKMAGRSRGAILLVSSLAGWLAQPYLAHYGAAKAYILSLGESLHHELKGKGVDVSVLSPGPTDTPMVTAAGIDFAAMGMAVMQPAAVAACGLSALGNQVHAVPGFGNRLTLFLMTRLMSRRWAGAIFKRMLGKALKIKPPTLQRS